MNVFKDTIQYIKDVGTKKYVGIPFDFGKFDNFLPYLEKKRYYLT